MKELQIKVLKRFVHPEFQPYVEEKLTACPCFTEGQTFVTSYEKPEGFCDWAWNDLYVYVVTLLNGGNFSEGNFAGWMKQKDTMIASCTDGIRPVVFELKVVTKK
jgi:uncharacterized repeat protein (TIGR04076 family)